MRFKPGEQVVCIRANNNKWIYNGMLFTGPKHGEIVTISSYNGGDCVHLVEYSICENGYFGINSYYEHNFEPLMDITELTEILEQQTEPHA